MKINCAVFIKPFGWLCAFSKTSTLYGNHKPTFHPSETCFEWKSLLKAQNFMYGNSIMFSSLRVLNTFFINIVKKLIYHFPAPSSQLDSKEHYFQPHKQSDSITHLVLLKALHLLNGRWWLAANAWVGAYSTSDFRTWEWPSYSKVSVDIKMESELVNCLAFMSSAK